MFTCQSNDPSEFNNLIKFDTYMYRISKRNSFKPFLPTCFRYQIHSGIEHGHDLCTTKNHRKSGNLKTFCFYLISFNIMVGFKAKAKASAYFTKLRWRRGCVCVWGGGYLWWLGCVRSVGMYWKEGRRELHHFIIFDTLRGHNWVHSVHRP